MKNISFFLIVIGILIVQGVAYQLVAQYQVQHGVLGNGGATVTDSLYRVSSTVGQAVIGVATDTVQIQRMGFWYVTRDLLTALAEAGGTLPRQFLLRQNYPNPFNPITTIEYSVARRARVKIVVFNLLGEQVAVLVDREHAPGRYRHVFNGVGLSSGVYFYKMISREYVKTRKMILLK
ncbi:MAG: T9SS type A sorting domain-containing protein [Calditrichaeota bacterium]|nr:T9SS type A sorting domain-containing protein [Calditrichota bacterium]